MAQHDDGLYCDVEFSSTNGEKHICSLTPEHWRQLKEHTCYCGHVMDIDTQGDCYSKITPGEPITSDEPEPADTFTITVTGGTLKSFSYTYTKYGVNILIDGFNVSEQS